MRKRHVTLLEVIIALALTVLILSTLTYFYQQVEMTGRAIDQIEEENFKWRFLENRLINMIPRTVSPSNKLKDFVFFTASEDSLTKQGNTSLIFTFESDVKLEKGFAFHAIGRLYLDKKDRLIFAYWPTPKWWKNDEAPLPKKEVLLEGVESLEFEFFIPPDKGKKEKEPANSKEPVLEPEPKGSWRKGTWLLDYKQPPALVKVIIKLKTGEQKTFILYVLKSKKPIVYE